MGHKKRNHKRKTGMYSKGAKGQRMVKTRLICPKCKNIYTHLRIENKRKHKGHKKNIYCITCKRVTEHVTLF